MIEIERIIKDNIWKSEKALAQAIKSYIIEIVGEEKEGADFIPFDNYQIRLTEVNAHNNLRTTILKRLEGE